MKFVGFIAFLDSEKEDRQTTVMDFAIAADWYISVTDFFQQMVMTGEYDGTEVLVNLHQYFGPAEPFQPSYDAVFDSDTLERTISIKNPYAS